jgi:[protein-PII] uridylyltransferase
VDRALIKLFGGSSAGSLALVATGGYGRGQLSPGSDIDLLMLHEPEDRALGEEAFRRVLYPLWNAGPRVGHAIRTVEECLREGERKLENLAAMLTSRPIAGSKRLFYEMRHGVAGLVEADRAGFMAGLMRWRDLRSARAGTVGERLEPDIKEGLGGLRDLLLIELKAQAPRTPGRWDRSREEEEEWLPAASRFFLLIREALHRVNGGSSNVLVVDRQEEIATLLGIVATDGWEPRDRLMRLVFEHGRRVAFATSAAMERAVRGGQEARSSRRRGPRDLLGLLMSSEAASTLERMAMRGELATLLPEWNTVQGRPQRDPYHQFPVDVHLIRTMAEAGRQLAAPDEPFAEEAVKLLDDPAPLLLAALLHDIGKVGLGSHVTVGEEIAGRIIERMALDDPKREDILFLVREHLLLSDTATRRSLEDEDLILHVAARVGDPRRLAMLYLLTVADSAATGPAANTPWRMTLIRELVAKVNRAFDRGLMDRDRADRIERAERAIRGALAAAGKGVQDVDRFIASMPPSYCLWVRPGDAPSHIGLVLPQPLGDEVRMHIAPGRTEGGWIVTVAAADRLGLLSAVAGALALAGLSILAARAFTTEDRTALDVFEVQGAFEEEVRHERWERFGESLKGALAGRVDIADRVLELRGHYGAPPSVVPVKVRLDQEASDFFTVVEVEAPDRLGLLFDLTRALSDREIDVHAANVATYGSRVVDVFYVTDRDELKVTSSERASELTEALHRALAPSHPA